jgi:hypothetical protein
MHLEENELEGLLRRFIIKNQHVLVDNAIQFIKQDSIINDYTFDNTDLEFRIKILIAEVSSWV